MFNYRYSNPRYTGYFPCFSRNSILVSLKTVKFNLLNCEKRVKTVNMMNYMNFIASWDMFVSIAMDQIHLFHR